MINLAEFGYIVAQAQRANWSDAPDGYDFENFVWDISKLLDVNVKEVDTLDEYEIKTKWVKKK